MESTSPRNFSSEKFVDQEGPPKPPPALTASPVKDVVAVLRRKTELPSQTFLKLVEDCKEVPNGEDRPPVGYRPRVGPHFLGDVLAAGKDARLGRRTSSS